MVQAPHLGPRFACSADDAPLSVAWMRLSSAAVERDAGGSSPADEGGDVRWQKKRERFFLGDWWTPAFLTMIEKGGGRCPSGGLCPRAAGGSDQRTQQADESWEEGRQHVTTQDGENRGSDHDSD